ncbi:MAG: hypothetical protein M0R68_12880, partial [Bacteroidetes bacterium]|nr:hypothetical protein [Bacteroidota bacterium]
MICISFQVVRAQGSPHGPLKLACTECHTTASWKELAVPMKFNHATTGFSLQGGHTNVQCLQCHSSKRFAGTSTDCFSCHQKDFSKAMAPNHQVGLLSHDCLTCHTVNSWRPSIFEHAKTDFQLIGAHASVECSSCHTNNRFNGLPNDCFYCHQKDFTSAKNPDHNIAQLSRDCLSCHSMNTWLPSKFDHNKTNFPLTGKHIAGECSSCHTNGQFKGVAQDCYSCHLKDFTDAVEPNHTKGQLSHACLECHSTAVWKPSTFSHGKTNFPLIGAHINVDCEKCHGNSQYKNLPGDCFSCHSAAFNKTVVPNHQTGQFSHECLTCHTNISWKPSTFDHAKTNFPLKGAHTSVDCASCHTKGQYKGLPSDCYNCHQPDFTATTTPNHVIAQFSHDCMTCHSNIAWKPATFNHNTTAFPLTGAH